jgi:hypothetical protein
MTIKTTSHSLETPQASTTPSLTQPTNQPPALSAIHAQAALFANTLRADHSNSAVNPASTQEQRSPLQARSMFNDESNVIIYGTAITPPNQMN